jgi:hypothetical protein
MTIYNKFKPLKKGDEWVVVTDDKNKLVVARIPYHIKHPATVAKVIATAMTHGTLGLTDLV